MKGFIKTLFLAASALLLIFLSAASMAQDTPSDLEISLYSAPLMPGAQPGPMSVTIGPNDNALLMKTGPGGEETTKNLTLDEGASAALWRVINEEGFFELDPLYQNPDILDGDYAEITVTANGQTKTVRTTNISNARFDTIGLWINSYLEPEDMILYNAFLEHGTGGDGS